MTGQDKVVALPRLNIQPPQDLRALVEDLAEWRHKPVAHTQLFVVDANGAVPAAKQTPEMTNTLVGGLCYVAARYGARAYKVAPTEYALLVQAEGSKSLELLRDVKIAMLRSVEKHAPEHFGHVNQARFAMIFDLAQNFRGAAERIAKYTADAQRAADPDAKKHELRPLSPEDLDNILHAFRKFGADKFLKAFMRDQMVVQAKPGQEPTPRMHEYFVSMDALRKPLFIDVEMRASGPLFNEFTRVLDQIVLRSFAHMSSVTPMPFSLNVNVVTTFTAAFADFMDQTHKDILSRLVFEFRQADIVEHFDEFEVARGMIKAMGASIGVDKIFPQTLGLVDLDYIGAQYAKVHWRAGAEDLLRDRGKTFKYMRECGIEPVLIRVDNMDALTLGAELGVDMFQGFAIDNLLRQTPKAA
ncbi:MAG: hypothetical protein AB7E79_14975 [Rhodospirillaceae bacterium]